MKGLLLILLGLVLVGLFTVVTVAKPLIRALVGCGP